jgi:hypothetical protein
LVSRPSRSEVNELVERLGVPRLPLSAVLRIK